MRSLVRFNPVRDMMSLREDMDRMFDSLWNTSVFGNRVTWLNPELDVVEDDDHFTVTVSVPGINPDDLEVQVTNNVLTISGEFKSEQETDEAHYHLHERRYGSFTRSFTLPATVDQDHIDASHDNGVLTLTIPKAESSKPHRISIQAGKGVKTIAGKLAEKVTGK